MRCLVKSFEMREVPSWSRRMIRYQRDGEIKTLTKGSNLRKNTKWIKDKESRYDDKDYSWLLLHSSGDDGERWSRMVKLGFGCLEFDVKHLQLLLLLLSHFSRVRLCATPETAAHQAPPSPGFSRQEHWSGLPFPSTTHKSEKWKGSQSLSRVRLLATPWTAPYQAPPSMGFSRQEYWSGVPLPSLRTSKECLSLNNLSKGATPPPTPFCSISQKCFTISYWHSHGKRFHSHQLRA